MRLLRILPILRCPPLKESLLEPLFETIILKLSSIIISNEHNQSKRGVLSAGSRQEKTKSLSLALLVFSRLFHCGPRSRRKNCLFVCHFSDLRSLFRQRNWQNIYGHTKLQHSNYVYVQLWFETESKNDSTSRRKRGV